MMYWTDLMNQVKNSFRLRCQNYQEYIGVVLYFYIILYFCLNNLRFLKIESNKLVFFYMKNVGHIPEWLDLRNQQ